MEKVRKSNDDLQEALNEQVTLLRHYCTEYDRGHEYFAKPIASSIFILCHEGNTNRSLLKLCGLRTKNKWLSSSYSRLFADYEKRGMIGERNHLYFISIPQGEHARCIPRLELDIQKQNHFLSFKNWWENEEVYLTRNRDKISRKYLIMAMRNTDNSGHMDPFEKYSNYLEMKRDGARITTVYAGNEWKTGLNAHLASVRQIGWEVNEYLKGFGI